MICSKKELCDGWLKYDFSKIWYNIVTAVSTKAYLLKNHSGASVSFVCENCYYLNLAQKWQTEIAETLGNKRDLLEPTIVQKIRTQK